MDVEPPVLPYGGVDGIGTSGSFYVSVNGRLDKGGLELPGLANATIDAS